MGVSPGGGARSAALVVLPSRRDRIPMAARAASAASDPETEFCRDRPLPLVQSDEGHLLGRRDCE